MQQPIGSLGFLVFFLKLSRIAISGNDLACFGMLRRLRILEILGTLDRLEIIRILRRLETLGIFGRLRMLGMLGSFDLFGPFDS